MSQYLNLKPVELDKLSAKVAAGIKWIGRLMLPKYDGCMAIVCFVDGKPDRIVSRTGERVLSMDHIYGDMLLRYPDLALRPGGVAFIGEAWLPGRTFAELSGTFRRQSPQAGLGFAVFDMVDYEAAGTVLSSSLPYAQREGWLEVHADRRAPGLVFPPLLVVCEGEEHAKRYAQTLKNMGGYDGCVAGDPFATYLPGSGSNGEFLKVKPLRSFTLEVVGVTASKGEKTGRDTVALQVRFKGGVCGVGTGFNHEQAELWAAFPATVVGTIIEVACMAVYDGPTGMMREPRFVGFRNDVIKADY